MEISLKLLSCKDIENWLACGDDYWQGQQPEYCGEGIEGLRVPLEIKVENMKKDPGNDQWYSYYLIIYRNRIVGMIGPKGRDDNKRSVEVGYGIGAKYRNRGLATAALKSFSRMFFQEGIEYITAHTHKSNTASRRVLEKCGFTKTGKEGDEFIWILKNPAG